MCLSFCVQNSIEDESLIQGALKNAPKRRMIIFDARSVLAAGGNKIMVSVGCCTCPIF